MHKYIVFYRAQNYMGEPHDCFDEVTLETSIKGANDIEDLLRFLIDKLGYAYVGLYSVLALE